MQPPSEAPRRPLSNGPSAPGAEPSSAPPPRSKISSHHEIAVVQADYLALSNDLEQAQSLSSSLELQLSGKTNELARFKLIWERTQTDLAKFAHDLETMRAERHSLANEVQRGYAFESKFERLTAAHDELTAKVVRIESELTQERAAHAQSRTHLEELKAKPRPEPVRAPLGNARDPELQQALEALRAQLDRVLGRATGVAPPAPSSAPKPDAPQHIDIEFSA